jgi:hypothetical protein
MTISYNPSTDELRLEFHPVRKHPSLTFGRFKVWYEEDRICAVRIERYVEAVSEFRKDLRRVRLGGIWKDVKIDEEDLKEVRATLLAELEGKW